MLDEHDVKYRYREYTEQALAAPEIKRVLKLLAVGPREVLRKNDKVYKELGLSGDENDNALIDLMAKHPTLLQRPIGILGDRAVLGRPAENLLVLIGDP